MIVVRVELHSAITRQITEIARMHICNIGGSHTKGDYAAATLRGRSKQDLDKNCKQRIGQVKNHSRLSLHVWHLVAKALSAMDYGKEKNTALVGSAGSSHGQVSAASGAEQETEA